VHKIPKQNHRRRYLGIVNCSWSQEPLNDHRREFSTNLYDHASALRRRQIYSSRSWQRYWKEIPGVSVYVDDVIVAAQKFQWFPLAGVEVLRRLNNWRIKLRPSKCVLIASKTFSSWKILDYRGLQDILIKSCLIVDQTNLARSGCFSKHCRSRSA
jgi:hypothetical protein